MRACVRACVYVCGVCVYVAVISWRCPKKMGVENRVISNKSIGELNAGILLCISCQVYIIKLTYYVYTM